MKRLVKWLSTVILAAGLVIATVLPSHSTQPLKPWMQEIAEGAVPRYSFVEKFGENPDIDTGTTPEAVWTHGGEYVFSDTADIDRIVSSSATDTHDITIVGLDENWDEVMQTITLTGQTPAALTTSLVRCYRAWNANAVALIGNVHIFVDSSTTAGVPDDDTKVRAGIKIDVSGASSGQTEMAVYTVPANHVGYLYAGYVGISRGGNLSMAEFVPQVRYFGGVFRTIYRGANIGQGSSYLQQPYNPPLVLPGKTDILVNVVNVGTNDTGIFAGFTIILKDLR